MFLISTFLFFAFPGIATRKMSFPGNEKTRVGLIHPETPNPEFHQNPAKFQKSSIFRPPFWKIGAEFWKTRKHVKFLFTFSTQIPSFIRFYFFWFFHFSTHPGPGNSFSGTKIFRVIGDTPKNEHAKFRRDRGKFQNCQIFQPPFPGCFPEFSKIQPYCTYSPNFQPPCQISSFYAFSFGV